MAEFKRVTKGFDLDKKFRFFMHEKKDLPLILGNLAKNHFLEGFEKGGGQTNDSLNGWQQRVIIDGGRAILVKSGMLRRDIKLKKYSFNRIVVGTSGITQDYASVHNKGYKKRNIPKREFIGKSNVLNKKIIKKIIFELNKVMKNGR